MNCFVLCDAIYVCDALPFAQRGKRFIYIIPRKFLGESISTTIMCILNIKTFAQTPTKWVNECLHLLKQISIWFMPVLSKTEPPASQSRQSPDMNTPNTIATTSNTNKWKHILFSLIFFWKTPDVIFQLIDFTPAVLAIDKLTHCNALRNWGRYMYILSALACLPQPSASRRFIIFVFQPNGGK